MYTRYLVLLCCSLLFFSCEIEPLPSENFNSDSTSLKSDNDSESGSGGCQTLFAKGNDTESTCFIDDGFERWGWTLGPLPGGDYSFELYAAAGQCDTEKGAPVGSLSIQYDELSGTAEVSYEMSDGYSLRETHLYVGNDPYPTNQDGDSTVSPGQFPDQHKLEGAANDSFTITGLSGEIYVIAHGVVCEDKDPNGGNDDGDDDDDDDGGFDTPV